MLKLDLNYKDQFTGEPVSSTLYFNITTDDFSNNLDLLDSLQKQFDLMNGRGADDEQSLEESSHQITLINRLIKLSYGRREGNRHVKNDDAWHEFVETGQKAALLSWFMEDNTRVADFMIQIFPEEFRDEEATQRLVEQSKAAQAAAPRLAPGTRIVNDVPVAPQLDTKTAEREIMVQHGSDSELTDGMTVITMKTADFMKSRLSDGQFIQYMQDKIIQM